MKNDELYKVGRKHTGLVCFHLEWFSELVVVDDSALKVFVQGPDDVDKLLSDAIISQNLLEGVSV
ncbi:hypothetical protein DPMN_017941 [Dreissena polymorpha]|uniref:Uncharacterized protein n=1 Tax=Dreissena polymorpha TaxID=45954 RepID=A0A9D4S7U6_DREPO|nr:hypothetical protein DPMN_017941 [Dreissena polymorpha]